MGKGKLQWVNKDTGEIIETEQPEIARIVRDEGQHPFEINTNELHRTLRVEASIEITGYAAMILESWLYHVPVWVIALRAFQARIAEQAKNENQN